MDKIANVTGRETSQFIATILVSTSLFILSLDTLSLPIQLTGIICYSIGRVGTFGMYFTSIGKRFGYVHYGRLAGLGLLISATASILQYPLIYVAAEWYWEVYVNVICGIMILCIGVPYCAWAKIEYWKQNKKKELNKKFIEMQLVIDDLEHKEEISC